MLHKLKSNIFWTIFITITLMLFAILIAFNAINIYQIQDSSRQALLSFSRLQDPEVSKEEKDSLIEDNPLIVSSNFCTITLAEDNTIENVQFSGATFLPQSKIDKLVSTIIANDVSDAQVDHNWYVYITSTSNHIIYLLDNSIINQNIISLIRNSIIFSVISLFLILVFAKVLSNILVNPTIEAFKKQKEFISNSSHELKTPLAVIQANLDVIECQYDDNKNMNYVKQEIKKMNELIESMLTLAKIDELSKKSDFKSFNLSRSALDICLPLEALSFEKNIQFKFDVSESLEYFGNEEQIKQLISILLDNAIRHTKSQGFVNLIIKKSRSNTIQIRVSNEGDEILPENREYIFERFYRAKTDVNNSEGNNFGLGLAIAKSIVTRHHGNISVDCKKGIVTFYVTL